MNLVLIVIFISILLFYGGLTYYIGLRGWQFIVASSLNFSIRGYWSFIWIIAFSFFIARGGYKWLPNWLSHPLEVIGAYWLGIMTYLTIILVLGELVNLLNTRLQFIPQNVTSQPRFIVTTGIVVISLALLIVSYGSWSGRNPKVIQYEVQLDNKIEKFQELNIVMLSDLHLGRLVDRRQLEKIVGQINHLNPDLILMPGDIIDDRIDVFVEQNMMEVFRNLNPPLGIYASMGNHEYMGGHIEDAEKYFKQSGIIVLRDEYIKVADMFYLVGREDKSSERFNGMPRRELKEILQNVDKQLPIIMLDHQPVDLDEANENGVDIQLSGHTHRGQLFPFRIFTRKIFTVDWGYEKIDNLHMIVTSGVGTWGPPIRVGHRSEIVNVKVKF